MSVSKTLMRKSFMIGARYSGLTSLMSPMFAGSGAILMLHRVGKRQNASGINSFLSIEGDFLHRLLQALKKSGIRFVTMDETIDRVKAGHFDERFATVTLDDGYRDNLLTATPIFKRHDVPYLIYACSGFVEASSSLWWEVLAKIIDKQSRISFATNYGMQSIDCSTKAQKLAAYDKLTDYLCTQVDEITQRKFVSELAAAYKVDEVAHCKHSIMDWNELRQVARNPLCTIGAHTLNHYHLKRIDREDALFEMEQSARVLELELGEKPTHFAYPYGGEIAVGKREAELAREAGFASAVTTRHGLLRADHKAHLHALPRISINGHYQRVHYVKTMLSGITVPVANRGKRFVTV